MKARPLEIAIPTAQPNYSPKIKNQSPIPNYCFISSQKHQISPSSKIATHISLSFLQKRALEKNKLNHKNLEPKIPEYIVSPFPLNRITQPDKTLNLSDEASFLQTQNFSQGANSPVMKQENNDRVLKSHKEDIELILANMQELSSFAKHPKAKKVLNRSLEVQGNPLATAFDASSSLSDHEKLSHRSDDSITLMLKTKNPLKNHYRRKSCCCSECGGISHLETEIQNNPHIPPTIVKKEPVVKKSLKGFAVIKHELGNLLSVNKKQQSFAIKQSPTNRKIGSRMQIASQQEIAVGKSMKVLRDDETGIESSKDKKKEVSLENRPSSKQESALKSAKAMESKSDKANNVDAVANRHNEKVKAQFQISVNGSPKNYVIRKEVSLNQTRQNSVQAKERSNIRITSKNSPSKRLNTKQSNRMVSHVSLSPRNLSVPSESSRKGSLGPEEIRFQKKKANDVINSDQMKLNLSPKEMESEQSELKGKRKIITYLKSSDKKETDKTEKDLSINFDGKDRQNLKQMLKRQVKMTQQDTEADAFASDAKVEKAKKIKIHTKKHFKDFMNRTFKERNQTLLKIYLSTSMSNFRTSDSKAEVSHSKDLKDVSCEEKTKTKENFKSNNVIIKEERREVRSRENYLRRLVNFKKDESPYKK